jgi:hypothetical protein
VTLGESIADQLGLGKGPLEDWSPELEPGTNFTGYMRRDVLRRLTSHLVWGLDEADRVFNLNFASDIFGLFRSWHNAKSLEPERPSPQLTLAIAYATESYLFINDVSQSPFKRGGNISLEDFNLDQIAELNRRYGAPLNCSREVASYFRLVGGQPYLVRRGLNEMVDRGRNFAELENVAHLEGGPFGDHLERILFLLTQDADLCRAVGSILEGQPRLSEENFRRLRRAGIMLGNSPNDARFRCRLYAEYLRLRLL